MVSAVHLLLRAGEGSRAIASKGLHMVSAVHLGDRYRVLPRIEASKGLHMVSAVHLALPRNLTPRYAFYSASKGLHMVSAVHLKCWIPPSPLSLLKIKLQRGCTWLVQFIFISTITLSSFALPGFKGAAHG